MEVDVGDVGPAGPRRLDVAVRDELRSEQDVVGAARARRAGAEGRPRRLEHGREVGRDRRGHQARDHRGRHAPRRLVA